MGDTRNVYVEPKQRALLRTADVYQTEVDDGVAGYSDTLLAVVANFRNSGCPEGANAQSMVGKSKRGEVACRLFAVVDPDTRVIERAGFKTRGCLAMTACASVVCSMIEGRTLEGALEVTIEDVRDALDGVPAGKSNTLYFAVEAVRALAGDYLAREGASVEELDAVVLCDEFSMACMMCEHCSLRDTRVEMLVDEQRAAENNAEARALAAVFADVRARSAASELVEPGRWSELGLVPEHMTPNDFEMLVYDYVMAWQNEHGADADASESAVEGAGADADEGEGAGESAGADASAGEGARVDSAPGVKDAAHTPTTCASGTFTPARAARPSAAASSSTVRAVSRFASRSVGVPRLFSKEPSAPVGPMPETLRALDPAPARPSGAGLNVPEGFELVELEGEWVLVEAPQDVSAVEPAPDASDIQVLVGAHSYYLYDASVMTDAYAHWAFLAAEDNPLVTFADCVREDSRVYPRPMARASFANPPFCMDAEAVEAAWELSREHVDYADVRRITASNGEVYFYSTTYLSDRRAQALAEWDAVERYRNV